MRPARPTARGVALLCVAVLAYVAARALGTWELYFLAVAFAAALGVCWVLVTASAGRVQVTRTVGPAQPVAGDGLTLTLRVKNGSPVPGLQVSAGRRRRHARGAGAAAGRGDPGAARRRAASTPARGRRGAACTTSPP